VGRRIGDLPTRKTSENATAHTSYAHIEPTNVTFLIQRETYSNVGVPGVTLDAYEFLWLGICPKFLTVTDKMFPTASGTDPFRYAFIIICHQLEDVGAARATH
jgi:hypothetical protein